MKTFVRNNWIIITIGISLMASMVMALRNRTTIKFNSELQQEAVLVKSEVEKILSKTIHGLDLGLRGYGLLQDDQMLVPFKEAIDGKAGLFITINNLLEKQNYPGRDELPELEAEVSKYIALCQETANQIKYDTSKASIIYMLKEDRGYQVWKKYDDFTKKLFAFEDQLNQDATDHYNEALSRNVILQACIILLVLPAVVLFVLRIKKESRSRQRLLKSVEDNDRKYMFNPGTKLSDDTTEVLNASIKNARSAADFVKSMANGNYEIVWEGLDQSNTQLNSNTLAGYLIEMREKMKMVKKEDEERNWINQGIAQFSEIVRNHQENKKQLGDHCVSFLAKYLKIQQCSLFTLTKTDSEESLELSACYAFNKKKWLEKKVGIGEGLVGQAFLEGDLIQLKDVPPNYVKITSGLGESLPRHILIIPLKYNDQISGIIEMASFEIVQSYQVDFLKKAAEYLSSALINSETTFHMKNLLEQSKINEANMRQREEELRQIMEEMQATQEENSRRQQYKESVELNGY